MLFTAILDAHPIYASWCHNKPEAVKKSSLYHYCYRTVSDLLLRFAERIRAHTGKKSLTHFGSSSDPSACGLCTSGRLASSNCRSRSSRCGIVYPMTRSKSSKTGSIGRGHVHKAPMPNTSMSSMDSSSDWLMVFVAFFFKRSIVPIPVIIP